MRDQVIYLSDILERIRRIEMFTEDGRDAFDESLVIQDAVIRGFEVIGEAVKRLSPSLTQKYPDIPWKQIAGFRDVLIHDYDEVDLDEVWDVIENHLPALKQAAEALLTDQQREDST